MSCLLGLAQAAALAAHYSSLQVAVGGGGLLCSLGCRPPSPPSALTDLPMFSNTCPCSVRQGATR